MVNLAYVHSPGGAVKRTVPPEIRKALDDTEQAVASTYGVNLDNARELNQVLAEAYEDNLLDMKLDEHGRLLTRYHSEASLMLLTIKTYHQHPEMSKAFLVAMQSHGLAPTIFSPSKPELFS